MYEKKLLYWPMKKGTLGQICGLTFFGKKCRSLALLSLALLAVGGLNAAPVVKTLSGGPSAANLNSSSGYSDGNTASEVQFNTPSGMSLDSSGTLLVIADRDNNAIRIVDLAGTETYTFGVSDTNLLNKPVGVVVDGADNVFVLNRGNGSNGTVVEFDGAFGDLIATNIAGLTNATGIALDSAGNIYVTIKSNTLIKVTAPGVSSVVTTIPIVGVQLQGIVVKENGLIAACDSGRNGIYLIDPANGLVTTNAGFHGAGDFPNGTTQASKANAKFNQPMNVAETGDGGLIVTDFGNNRVKYVRASDGAVFNIYGCASNYWYTGVGANYPGWYDGTVSTTGDVLGGVEARLPFGVVFASDGTIYVSEDYYHIIRSVTGTGLALPPSPPPPPPSPKIGWFDYEGDLNLGFYTVLHPISSFTFNNDRLLAIDPGTNGVQTFFTAGVTGTVPDPSPTNGAATPPSYQDGLTFVTPLPVTTVPDLTIKAVNISGKQSSPIVSARIKFVAGNPLIVGNNAASFTISDVTTNVTIYYTIDGTDPTNTGANFIVLTNGNSPLLSLNASSNLTFKARAFKPGYQTSGVTLQTFSPDSFHPNSITFGASSGEPSSSFIARPGQFFYAPVTLQLLPNFDKMYSLQFNVAVTNGFTNILTGSGAIPKIVNGAGIDFFPMLMTKVSPGEGRYFPPADGNWYLTLPNLTPISPTASNTVPTMFVNTNNNLLGIGWLYRTGFKYKFSDTNGNAFLDFDTTAQDLISYSIVHDTLFLKANGIVAVGAYSFQVPLNATNGDQYFIQIGSPSATSDGVGANGSSIFLAPPALSQAVTVGSPAYLVGDVAPFRWLNAGDFGNTNLDNSDVMQVYQSGVALVNLPPANSDLYAAMDSAGSIGVYDSTKGYYTNAYSYTNSYGAGSLTNLWDGNDSTINTNVFGDGILDINDLYVTFRRSLDPSLLWFKRFWTNGQFVAVTNQNYAYNSNSPHLLLPQKSGGSGSVLTPLAAGGQPSYLNSSVVFSAGDAVAGANSTIQIPINATVLGSYPLRVLALNLTVHPLDGSPAITQQVTFTPSAAIGSPSITLSKNPANFTAAWLNSGISGLSGTANIGTLTVTVPTNATSSSSYAVHFDFGSGSPNGIAVFPNQKFTGIITTTARTNSYFNDGIPDSWRLRWFGTIYNALSQSNAVATGDGISNWKKFIAGVDPTVPGSFPKVNPKSTVNAGYNATIHWPTVVGKKYAIERSTTLFSGNWSILATNTGTGGDMEFNDTNTSNAKFYRVRILP